MASPWEQFVNKERRKKADSVFLSISMDNGHDSAYTIHVENHSKFDVEISCISLWSNGQRIGQDAFPPENDW